MQVRYRPVQVNCAIYVCFKYTSCVSVELRFLPAVREVIKVIANITKNLLHYVGTTGPSSHCIMVHIRACLLSQHQTLQIYHTEHVRRLKITFPSLYINFSLFPLPSVVTVVPLQSTYVLGIGRWQVKPLNPCHFLFMAVRSTPGL